MSLSSIVARVWSAATVLWRARPKTTLAIGALVVLALIVLVSLRGGNSVAEVPAAPRHVDLLSVATYAQKGSVGTGVSTHESVLRAEAGGMVSQVVPVGTHVAAGQVIAQLSNDSQRAALLQYGGALDSAKASQQKVVEGTRTEQRSILEASYTSAQNSAISALLTAYSSLNSAVRNTADLMFSNPETVTPALIFNTTNSNREAYLVNTRIQLQPVLTRETDKSGTLSSSDDLAAEIAKTGDEVRLAYQFMDALVASLNDAIPTANFSSATITADKTAATTARASLTTALSLLTTAQNSLVSAQKSLEEAQNGAQDTDLSSAAAGVKQSQGAYDSALAAYEKTIIRARTGGVVVACSAKVGDVLGVGDDVCRIASSNADLGTSFALPLSAVKFTPVGAYVFEVTDHSTIHAVAVEAGLVTADKIYIYGLTGSETVVQDVRGLKEGDTVATN